MTDWMYVLLPLLALPIVVLFRFVGCGELLPAYEEPPTTETKKLLYRDYILGLANDPTLVPNPEIAPNGGDVVGYWRLVDAPGATVAKDEKGFQDGTYVLPGVLADEPGNNSEGAGGTFVFNQGSLNLTDPAVKGRYFGGAYVLIPWKVGLYPEDFTIEAWITPGWNKLTGYEHTLFSAGGLYAIPPSNTAAPHGFQLAANAQNSWFVALAPLVTGPIPLAAMPVAMLANTHIAVTVERVGTQRRVRVFINGGLAAENAAVADYSPPTNAPLFIGIENGRPNPQQAPDVRQPILSVVQEVVLHKKALPAREIENHFAINK